MKFVQAVKELQQQVLDGELTGWKREQQLAGNGLQMTLSLETIQVQTALQLFNKGGGWVAASWQWSPDDTQPRDIQVG